MKHHHHKQRSGIASRKNIVVAVFVVIAVIVISSTFFFLYPLVSQSENNTAAGASSKAFEIQSFRGILSGTLGSIGEKAQQLGEQITETAHNPFAQQTANNADKSPAPSADTFSFAILGDTQYFNAGDSQGNFQKAMASIRKINPDLVFAVGDLVGNCESNDKCTKDYANWKNVVGSLMPKTYATQGNHDRAGEDKADNVWRSSFNFPANGPSNYIEQTYSFDFENSHFIILDSDKPSLHKINEGQRAWLEKDLAANKKDDTFVFFHEPAFPVSSKVGESLDKNPQDRDALWRIFDKYNVTAIFNGHEHIVSRRKIDSKVFPNAKNSIYQLVFGDTDSFDHALPDPGITEYAHREQGCFGFVKVSGKEITVETHNRNGDLLDSFVFSR